MSDIKRQLGKLGKEDSSIRSRLNRLYQQESRGEKYFPEEEVVRAHKRLEEMVPGGYVNTPSGDIYRARQKYPRDFQHGTCLLDDLFDLDPDRLGKLGNIREPAVVDLDDALFLDTEASGLSGGTGTYAFMVGLGYYDRDEFVVDQLFVDSYAKEDGMLDLLREYLVSASLLVTFNGKSFDVNLLRTRYLIHQQLDPFEGIPHLDLLHPSRNLWDLTLENCKLQTLEKEVLQFYREDDTPGSEVPGIYFEFIRTHNPIRIADVFEHNLWDIVSLSALTIMLERSFKGDRLIASEDGRTMFSRGKIHEREGELEEALACYESSLDSALSDTRLNNVLSRAAGVCKRLKRWDRAVGFWKRQIGEVSLFALEPYVELAKYFEHQVRDYRRAMGLVVRAIELLPGHRTGERDALAHRLDRLNRRLENDE